MVPCTGIGELSFPVLSCPLEWLAEAGGRDEFDVTDIPFKETREYVERVERYRALYMRVHPDAFE